MIIALLTLILFALFVPGLLRLITGLIGAAFIYLIIISVSGHTHEIEATQPPCRNDVAESPYHAELPPQPQTKRKSAMKKTHASIAALAMLTTPTLADTPPPAERPTRVNVEQPISPVTAKTRVDTATAAYDAAVNDYVKLQNRAALIEATDAKTQIKTKLTGDTVKPSPEVQATYDAKDIAEARMNAAEEIMNAAIADMGGSK
jgi:hypothetical protein